MIKINFDIIKENMIHDFNDLIKIIETQIKLIDKSDDLTELSFALKIGMNSFSDQLEKMKNNSVSEK